MLQRAKRLISGLWDKHRTLFIFSILLLFFVGIFLISPKSSVIYYNGFSEASHFEVSETQTFHIRIREDPNYGRITFRTYPERTIQVVNQGLLLNNQWRNSDWTVYEDEQIFLFDEGIATLSCANYLDLTIKMPDASPFSYSLGIEQKSSSTGKEKNEITIANFPEKALIIMQSTSSIDMKGNATKSMMQAGEYQILNCDSISFFMCPASDVTAYEKQEYGLSAAISSFQIKNSERQMLEFTVDAQPEFREIGHIELTGESKKSESLTTEITDLGAYPVPVTLSGSVGNLKIAGHSFYPTLTQWLRENMTPILLALIGVFLSAIFKPSSES